MAKGLIWSKSASREFTKIFKYWNDRNQSPVYSQKLRKKINGIFQLICENNFLGRPASKPGVRFTICEKYLLLQNFWDSYYCNSHFRRKKKS